VSVPCRVVILAGGKGTRLAPYTTVLPKPLMPFGDRPILEYVIEQLASDGLTDVVMSVGHLAELLESYFRDGSRFGVRITYLREDHPLGTAGPLLEVGGDKPLLVLNGDTLTDLDYAEFVSGHVASGAEVTLGLAPLDTQIGYGVIATDPYGSVTSYDEKPTLRHQISMGIYVVSPSALDVLRRGERVDFPDLVRRLLGAGRRVRGHAHTSFWLDIGRRDDYERAMSDPDAVLARAFRGRRP
jgi:NDP-sugar pyrophosphorylase family protein